MSEPDVHLIDTYEQSYDDITATLEAAADAREPISVTTCSNTVATYLPLGKEREAIAARIVADEQKCQDAISADPTNPHLAGRLAGLQRARDIVLARQITKEDT